ncbi:metallophosphoesterase [Sulfolobus sp. A20]|uniref:metallophosphoesterase family protein n=1 Tax=Sulfolobaceae TaxID=118883 RepID=UPI000845D9FB|nr:MULTISPECIES: metallophosphoesterase [unclassified Sulfolobus]TRM74088.1 metallophosphoesterase [Sulfolobus sp. B5]TRM74678.1 metallophosphoesterase [Sulfolobus sp. A20-N-F8]TRM75209.1 metallophosphoesterase [Sulfolobus sp. E5]TRM85056.1 metallophosphoesterase [Sulfolobus sp. F3]TRM86803.1 metallophosphoesterase [Sulfolobus sp. C3]TRM98512.1 metallophosphoesterase [Sulfolobus sp. F1]TRM98713.1 metallophosphoesterase [Sulfolobus sp. E1]
MARDIRIVFSSDFHGNEIVFRKALNVTKAIKADYLILGGDFAGKGVIIILKRGEEYYIGNESVTKEDIESYQKNGYYIYISESKEEVNDIESSNEKIMRLFYDLAKSQLERWISLVNEKLKDTKVIWSVGNDDPFIIDDVFKSYKIEFEGLTEIDSSSSPLMVISYGFTNQTPYKSFRVVPEYTIYNKGIELLNKVIINTKNIILNFHVPPYNTKLDNAYINGRWVHVGSTSLRELIERYNPLLGLHGHIHESSGIDSINGTVLINPGSLYFENILKYAVITIRKNVESFSVKYKIVNKGIYQG